LSKLAALEQLANEKVILLDGAMGTELQRKGLSDKDFTLDGNVALGCNEILNLTTPETIYDIHLSYLEAGADIIETNTFNSNVISLDEYNLGSYTYSINLAAAEIAKAAVESYSNEKRFIAGVVGPTGKMATISPVVDDPTFRDVTFKDFVASFIPQIEGLVDGGVDLLLIETAFDTLVAKAALKAANDVFDSKGKKLPIMVSATFSDQSDRMLAGQTLEAFVTSLSSYELFSIGLNCSTGAQEMIPLIKRLDNVSPFRISAHPNAGFPDLDGNYTQSVEELTTLLEPLIKERRLNIVGGCCGTTPIHIAALAKIVKQGKQRELKKLSSISLSNLDNLNLDIKKPIVVGERTNVAGSRKFARLIREKRYESALEVARQQISFGANIIDICMDEPLIESKEAMVDFLRMATSDPTIAKVPFMIDSSDWTVIEAALEQLQGRGIVNSISLKEGEKEFLRKANHINKMGFAMVVMLFDENGQAETYQRKIDIAKRSYSLLIENNIHPSSIIFDPNILTIATSIKEHDYYAKDFIDATKWIKENLPQVSVIGGVSNLSFAFRGNNYFREAMHAVFLHLANLDYAIVNPATFLDYTTLDKELFETIKKVILATSDDVESDRERMIKLALKSSDIKVQQKESEVSEWRSWDVYQRLSHSLLIGEDKFLEGDLKEVEEVDPLVLIEGPLMEGMKQVGKLFQEGELFLPQVIRSARTMKKGVDIIKPRIKIDESRKRRKKVVLATVKGDVHDIGKNIVGLVLESNNYEVINLGVMVDEKVILDIALKEEADVVGLSGLITPSLTQMANVSRLFEKEGLKIPIVVGGATTSERHTALKLDPLYSGGVYHVTDASNGVIAIQQIINNHASYKKEIKNIYQKHHQEERSIQNIFTLKESRSKGFIKKQSAPKAKSYGVHIIDNVKVDDLIPHINWSSFLAQWKVPSKSDEGKKLIDEAKKVLNSDKIKKEFNKGLKGVVGIFEVTRDPLDVVTLFDKNKEVAKFKFLRSQIADHDKLCRSLADYVHQSEKDTIALFAATSGYKAKGDSYDDFLLTSVSDRLVEAFSLYLENFMRDQLWAFKEGAIIRPAIGYPIAPDHQQKETLFNLLNVSETIGVKLTDSYAMDPVSSVAGFYFVGEGVKYFPLKGISKEQLSEYANFVDVNINDLEKRMLVEGV
jgi:5-methyltetrahydrofolate--homocysteine methyltransferase